MPLIKLSTLLGSGEECDGIARGSAVEVEEKLGVPKHDMMPWQRTLSDFNEPWVRYNETRAMLETNVHVCRYKFVIF